MNLDDKVALIYGGGGHIGGAVAQAFAREGARVYLAGRNGAALEAVGTEIRAQGGLAEWALVDALDEGSVETFVENIAGQTGRIDISFNLIGYQDVQKPLMDLSVDEFMSPIQTAARTQFLTTRAAARQMITRRSGVILFFGGGGPQTPPGLGGFKVALDAVESLRRQWAVELGPHGIRVVTLQTGGIPETLPEDFPNREAFSAEFDQAALLGRAAGLEDVGRVATFLASDQAAAITATQVNISAGAIID